MGGGWGSISQKKKEIGVRVGLFKKQKGAGKFENILSLEDIKTDYKISKEKF